MVDWNDDPLADAESAFPVDGWDDEEGISDATMSNDRTWCRHGIPAQTCPSCRPRVASKEPVVHLALATLRDGRQFPHPQHLVANGTVTTDPAKVTCPVCKRAMADLLLLFIEKEKEGGPLRMMLETAALNCDRIGQWLRKVSRRV
jgi:hypothetical protein